jgi:hypothetical protein
MAICAYSAGVGMTQDEIIEMASQVYGECVWHESALLRLEAFVKLVEDKAFQDGYEKGIAAFNEAVELEREACAKLAEEYGTWGGSGFYEWFKKLGAEIRARGEA